MPVSAAVCSFSLWRRLLLGSSGFRVCAQELWLVGSAAPGHVGSSWTKDQTRVSCTGRRFFTHGSSGKPLECVLKGDSFKTLNGNQGRLPATCLVGPHPEASREWVWAVIVHRSHGVASSLVAPRCWNQCPAQSRSSPGEGKSAGRGPRVQRTRPPTRQVVGPAAERAPARRLLGAGPQPRWAYGVPLSP